MYGTKEQAVMHDLYIIVIATFIGNEMFLSTCCLLSKTCYYSFGLNASVRMGPRTQVELTITFFPVLKCHAF